MMKEEYMLHIWGGAWNEDANPSIEKDHGVKEGYYYFNTKEELDEFCKILSIKKYARQGIVRDIKHGIMTHKRTIFVAKLKYEDREFIIHYDFGYEYPNDSAEYVFLNGNYSCDCNRSLFIREEYGNESIQELPCGEEIEMTDYWIEYEE